MESHNNDEQLALAIADLKSQDTPNYNGTAKKYGIARSTLRRRFKGETVSIQQHHAEKLQCLNTIQEQTLIDQISKLTHLGCPPTPQITRNLAEAIIGHSVGKNWHAGFIRRHKNRLHSFYLHNIDSDRQKAEYKPMFKHYFALVSAS